MGFIEHSVNCYFCANLVDEHECFPADEYNGNDGGYICPKCQELHPLFAEQFLAELDRRMKIAWDVKKTITYAKSEGKWYWVDRDEVNVMDAYHGPFQSYWTALDAAIEPYLDEEEV